MFALELTNANGTLESLSPRIEKHGPDKVPACDLKISVPTGSEILAHFSPTLKHFLFDENGPRDLADGLPLRDPHMQYPLARDEEMTGVTVQIAYGVGKPLEFADCKVNQIKLTPFDGGTVTLTFRVQCKPDEKQIGKLYQLQEQAITVSVEPAPLPTMREAA